MQSSGTVKVFQDEFAKHMASGSHESFQPSAAAASALTQLTGTLERARQTGSLSDSERAMLSEIDEMWEGITRFNLRKAQDKLGRPPMFGSPVYDLGQSLLREELGETSDAAFAKISEADAEKIIADLNQQFEEKILGKTKSASVQSPGPESGRGLQDYVQTVHDRMPSVPFADEDSHFDLSKLVRTP